MMMRTQLILAATGTLFLTACVDPNAYPNDPNARQRNGAVIGGVVVYLDDNHLTWSYARTLAPALVQRSRAVLERFGYVDTAQDSWAAPS